MKKMSLLLLLLLVIPFKVYAKTGTVDTSFDNTNCVLTVSGTHTGHDATVSLFDNNGKLIGLKTGEITEYNYSVDFVLIYDTQTTISATVSNEAGGSEIRKENISIPACEAPELPDGRVDELFDDQENSIMINDKNVGFEEDDFLDFELIDEESLNQLLESLQGEEGYEEIQALVNNILEDIGAYRRFLAVSNIHVLNRDEEEIDYSNYNGGFTFNLSMPKEIFNELKGLRIAPVNQETGKLEDELEYNYDEENEILVFSFSQPGIFIFYIDQDYEFLENTDNPIFDLNGKEDIVLKIDALLDKFIDLYINNKKVDDANFKLESGSTIITIKKELLSSLSEGSYDIQVHFNDGTAETTLTVKNNSSILNPLTWDSIYQWLGLFLLSTIGLSFAIQKNIKAKK